MLEKARTFEADVLMLDLEDSVPENDEAKTRARQEITEALDGPWAAREIGIRINKIGSPWFKDDVAFVLERGVGTVILPKVGSVEDMKFIEESFDGQGASPDVQFIMSVETPRCLIELDRVVAQSPRISCLIAGGFDFTLETAPIRLIGTDEGLGDAHITYALQRTLAVARAHGLNALRSCLVMNFRDNDRVRKVAQDARSFGFDGMATYYPGHIEVLNDVFAPSQEELTWAQETIRLLEESNATGRAALNRNGLVVLPQHGKLARKLLDYAAELGLGKGVTS